MTFQARQCTCGHKLHEQPNGKGWIYCHGCRKWVNDFINYNEYVI